MRIMLEKLWDEYFAEECARVETARGRELAKKAISENKLAKEHLTKEQSDLIEKYIDTLCEIQQLFVKKAFFKGCEFAISFLPESFPSDII